MHFFSEALTSSWTTFQYLCLIYCIGLGIEFLRPAESPQPIARIGFNIAYTFIFLFFTSLLVPPLQGLIKPVVDRFGLAIPIAFPDGMLGQILQAFTFFFIFDFFYYWLHRSQHTFDLLWAEHRVHHSEYSLNITTGNRHHWLEEPIRVFAVWLPIGLLFQQKAVTLAWLWSGFMLWGYFIHMNIRLPLGFLTPVICGPQLHRLHHSREPEHLDKNFAAFFPVFDVLFGTYVKPKRDEYPGTGLADGDDLNNLVRANFAPILYLRKRFAKKQPAPSA